MHLLYGDSIGLSRSLAVLNVLAIVKRQIFMTFLARNQHHTLLVVPQALLEQAGGFDRRAGGKSNDMVVRERHMHDMCVAVIQPAHTRAPVAAATCLCLMHELSPSVSCATSL